MDFIFTYSLPEFLEKEILDFISRQEFFVAEQCPYWPAITGHSGAVCFFILRNDNDRIISYALINENPGFPGTAHIHFGPVCNGSAVIIDSVRIINSYYRGKKFSRLSIQLAIKTGPEADIIEYKLNSEIRIRYRFDRSNWSSLELELTPPAAEIFRNFSEGHRRNIKKAEKLGLKVVSMPVTDNDLHDFGEIYISMKKSRGLKADNRYVHELLQRLNVLFISSNKGNFYLVKDMAGNIAGGAVILYQGKSVRYYLGASDPERRDLPVLHSAFWKAVKDSKEKGFIFFDFWGYNHIVDEKDQIWHINRFKKGFGGQYIFFPKIMYINYRPFLLLIYDFLVRTRGYFRRNG